MIHGCFTTTRVDAVPSSPTGVGARGWSRHVDRLRRDGEALFGGSVTAAAMGRALLDEVEASLAVGNTLPRIVRLALTGADLEVRATSRDLLGPADPLHVVVVAHERVRPQMKHTGTAAEFAVKDTAIAAGYDDALLIGADGLLREGTFWTLLLGRPDGSWATPAAPVLPSVTLALIAQAWERDGVTLETIPIGPADLAQFDRAVALSAGQGPRAIASITVPDGPRGSTWHGGGDVDLVVSTYARCEVEPITPA